MIGNRHIFLFVIIFFFAPFVWCQVQPDTITLRGTGSDATVLSNNTLHVWMQGEQEGSEVCLGPKRFLENEGFRPGVGDNIEVTGVRVGDGSLLVANSLQMGGKTLALRTMQAAGPRANGGCGGGCGGGGCVGYEHHWNHHPCGHCCDDQ